MKPDTDPPLWIKLPVLFAMFLVNVAVLWIPVTFLVALVRGTLTWPGFLWPF